jgi:Tol biopolymer transport system component
VVSKSELLAAAWPGAVVEENNLNQAISVLRHALGDTAADPRYIATVTGRGYQFVAPVATGAEKTGAGRSQRRRPILAAVALVGLALAALLIFWRSSGPGVAPPIIEQFAAANLALVTALPGSHSLPAFSPDGSMMAFTSDATGLPQIWVMHLQQGDPQQITFGAAAGSSPSWSPDGSQILFERQTPEGPEIWSVGPLGTPPPRRVVEHGQRPRFAARAPYFTYTTGRSVWITGNDGSAARRLDHLPSGPGFASLAPTLSPDGQTLAFVHAREGPLGTLWLTPVAGGKARQLTTLDSGGGYVDAPAFTADGRHLIYGVNSGTAHAQLWRVDVSTGHAQALTTGPTGSSQPAISIDGTRLLFTQTHNTSRIARIDPASRERKTVFDSRNLIILPLLSRARQKFVFFSMTPSGLQVFTVGIDGENLRQHTFDTPAQNTLPFWDGRDIVYYRDRSLARLDLDEGTSTILVPEFHWSRRTWPTISGDKLAYFEFDRNTAFFRAAIRDLASGEELELDAAIQSADWNAAGDALIGNVSFFGPITLCSAVSGACAAIAQGDETVGSQPKWSADESRIFYLRQPEQTQCCELWVMDAKGTNAKAVVQLANYDLKNSFYSVGAEDVIYYNYADHSSDEIWLATLR